MTRTSARRSSCSSTSGRIREPIDEIVVFDADRDQIRSIVELQLERLRVRLATEDLELSDDAVALIAERAGIRRQRGR
jgi:ATP-dependent Clp protease ATP-binding subunit ClpA